LAITLLTIFGLRSGLFYAVCKDFGGDLIGDLANNRSGREVFDILHRRAWRENLDFIRNSERSNRRWRALFWPLEDLHKLDRARVMATFRTWNALPEGSLRTSLKQWSQKWNLDADWCRDHALIVLLRFLFNKGLQESFLHPHEPNQNPFLYPPKAQTFEWPENTSPVVGKPNNWLASIWTSVALEPLQGQWSEYWKERWHANLTVSRDVLSCSVFVDSEPARFVVDEFNDNGWNFLDESFAEFSRRVDIHFRIHIAQEESLRLSALTKDGGVPSEADYLSFTNWRDRKLRTFKKAIAKYAKLSNEHRSEVLSEGYLVGAPSKRKLDQHLRLTIRYRIPDSSLLTPTLVSIGKASAVSKAINETLKLIGLRVRSAKPTGGRKRGSKNKYSSLKLGRENKSST
jgi:hypothetical protein